MLSFVYDESNMLIGLTYEGNQYFYDRTITGDIKSIIDIDGNIKVSYSYDDFGVPTITSDTSLIGESLKELNPYMYKGYFYDKETGWFYLKSRYYNPVWGRFITPDDVSYLDPTSVNGLNLYAYCNNNPIMYYDPSGHIAILIGLIIGALIGFGTAAYIDYQDDGEIFNGSVKWYDYLGATVLGGAIGAGLGAFAGMSFSATLPTGFAMAQTSAGTMALVATGSMTLTVTGAQILATVATLTGAVFMSILPKQGGEPNSIVEENGSIGYYDENGNLILRIDTTHSHYIKGLGQYCNPHIHRYIWKFIKDAWRVVKEIVLPY